MKTIKFILLCAFFISTSVFCFAQSKQDSIMKNDTSAVKIKEVIILGIRASDKIPVTKTNISKTDIAKSYYAEETPMFLKGQPNITVSSDGGNTQGYTYFRLRGIDQTRINMTLEGVPLNEPEDQGAYTSNYPDFLSSIQSIQIQRGVGTSSNGVSSYGGSINFEAPYGKESLQQIETSIGEYNTWRNTIIYSSGTLKKQYSFFTRLSFNSSNGYKYHSGNSGYSFFTSGQWLKNKNNLKFIVFSGNAKNNMAWLAVKKSDIDNDPRTNYNTEREDDHFRQTTSILKHTYNDGNYVMNNSLYGTFLEGNWKLDLLPYGEDIINNYQLNSEMYGFIHSSNYHINKWNIAVGVHLQTYKRIHSSIILPNNVTDYTNIGKKREMSIFYKTSYESNKMLYYVDIQYRNTSFNYDGMFPLSLNWHFINPKIGINYKPKKNISIYYFFGVSHREPTRTDIFQGNDNPTNYNNIKPETVKDHEIGISWKKNIITLNLNAYYMTFNNEITHLGALGTNGLPLMNNVSLSYRSGIELESNLKYGPFEVNNNMSISKNKVIDEEKEFTPLYTSPFICNTNITYLTNNKKTSIGISHKLQKGVYINWGNTLQTPDFNVFDIYLRQNITKEFVIFVNINNITNKQYFTNGYVIDNEPYYFINMPRNIMVKLSYTLWI